MVPDRKRLLRQPFLLGITLYPLEMIVYEHIPASIIAMGLPVAHIEPVRSEMMNSRAILYVAAGAGALCLML